MEYSYSKLDPDVYTIDGVFTNNEFLEIYDEFLNPYSRIKAKREFSTSKSKPYWFSLHKGASSEHGLGDHLKFISYGYRIQYFIKKLLRPNFDFQLMRINTNIQYQYQDSAFHRDGYYSVVDGVEVPKWTWTFLLFASRDWNTEWGGEFICSTNVPGKYQNISFIPNRCVLFNGHRDHRGSSPNCFSEMPRESIAWTFSSVDAHINPDATSYIS